MGKYAEYVKKQKQYYGEANAQKKSNANNSYHPTVQIGNKKVTIPEAITSNTNIDDYNNRWNEYFQKEYQRALMRNPGYREQMMYQKYQEEGNFDGMAKVQAGMALKKNTKQYGDQIKTYDTQSDNIKNRIQTLNTKINESQNQDMNSESGLMSQKTKNLMAERDALTNQYNSVTSQRDKLTPYTDSNALYSHFYNEAVTDSMNADKDKEAYIKHGKTLNGYERPYGEVDVADVITGGNKTLALSSYAMMSDDEKDQYNYTLGKYGKEEADKYLATTSFNYNDANYINDELEKQGDVVGGLGKFGMSVAAGVGDFATGMANIPYAITDDENLKVDHNIIQDIADVSAERAGNDIDPYSMALKAGRAMGRMLPSMAMGNALGGTMGSAVDAASMFGGSYADIRGEDSDRAQSLLYAGAQAGIEFATENYLGSIPGLRGTGTSNLFNRISSKFDDMILGSTKLTGKAARIANGLAKVGMSGLEEGAEEYVGAVLDPVMRNVIYGENNEFVLWNDDIAEQVAIGALLGGVTNSVQVAGNNYSMKNAGGKIVANGKVDELISEGLTFSKDSLAFRVAQNIQSRQEAGTAPTAEDVGMLYQFVEMQASDSDSIGRYLSGNSNAWNDLNYDTKRALLNPDNIAENNERYSLNIPEGSTPNEIADYLKSVSENVSVERINTWEAQAKENGYSERAINVVSKAIKKGNVSVEIMSEEDVPKSKDGTLADGYINNGKIYVNPNLSETEMLNVVVKHEMTHRFEGTKEYEAYAERAIKNIESKYNINAIEQGIREDYASILNTTPEEVSAETVRSEMVAKYTEELFTDIEAVEKLYNEDKNLFNKIYDNIKSLIKMYGAKNIEDSQIIAAERLFKKVVESDGKVNNSKTSQYRIVR